MLDIVIPASEQWDESKQEFVCTNEQSLRLEHSLVSISKWESRWHKPFLSKKAKTYEEELDYIRCMTLTKNVEPEVYASLSEMNGRQINEYIDDTMSATYFHEEKRGQSSNETITSELIYYWMITWNIPVEFQKWHLNRLLTLIRVCSIKNQPPKKRSRKELMNRNSSLNAARKKQLKTNG